MLPILGNSPQQSILEQHVVVFVASAVVIFHAWCVANIADVGSTLGGIVNSITIMILNHLYMSIAEWMNNYENHRSQAMTVIEVEFSQQRKKTAYYYYFFK